MKTRRRSASSGCVSNIERPGKRRGSSKLGVRQQSGFHRSYSGLGPARSMRHAVEFRDLVELIDPCLLRANKYLPAWHQFISLAKRSYADVVGFWLIATRCCIDRGPAMRAESLQTHVSTIGGLSIFRRFAGQQHERAWMSDDYCSQWTATHGLAICAVANGRRFGIGFRLERNVAAVTASINFHDRFPTRRLIRSPRRRARAASAARRGRGPLP
jgi:hypothetical protein